MSREGRTCASDVSQMHIQLVSYRHEGLIHLFVNLRASVCKCVYPTVKCGERVRRVFYRERGMCVCVSDYSN